MLLLSFVFSIMFCILCSCFLFFFNDTATTEIYTLSLHDALPIYDRILGHRGCIACSASLALELPTWTKSPQIHRDRKSTRLNSSHGYISYAVFCLKKKKKRKQTTQAHAAHVTTESQQPHTRHTMT